MTASPCKNSARLDTIRSPFDDGRAEPCDQNGRPLHAGADETLGKFRLLDALASFGAAARVPMTAQDLIDRAPGAVAGLERSFIDAHFDEALEQALNVLRAYSRPEPARETTVRRADRQGFETREALARAAMAFDPGYSAAQEEAAMGARMLNCGLCMFAAGFVACALVWAAAAALL